MWGDEVQNQLEAFRASLPEAYSKRYSKQEVASHCATSMARAVAEGSPAAWVGVADLPAAQQKLSESNPGLLGLCIVGADRPGLFSSIAAALRLRNLDIISAETYTRHPGDQPAEVVDIFCLRQSTEALGEKRWPADTAAAVCHTLLGLLSGKLDPHQSLPPSRRGPPPEVMDTIVRFLEGETGSLSTLEVETGDRAGLLLALAEALARQEVSIVDSEVVTLDNRVRDRFTLGGARGRPIDEAQRLNIQVAVLGAIQFSF